MSETNNNRIVLMHQPFSFEQARADLAAMLAPEWHRAEGRAECDPEQPQSAGISPATARAFLVFATDWIRTSGQQRKAADLTPDQYGAAVYELMKQKLVRYLETKTFKSGGQCKFLWPTPAGLAYLREATAKFMGPCGDAPPSGSNDGTHLWYQHKVARWLARRKWAVQIEQTLRQKRVDVGAILDGRLMHAYEIVHSPPLEKEVSNLRKNLDDGWHKTIFCIGTEDTARSLSSLVQEKLGVLCLDRMEVKLFREFR